MSYVVIGCHVAGHAKEMYYVKVVVIDYAYHLAVTDPEGAQGNLIS